MKSYIPFIALVVSFIFNSNMYAQNFSIHENGITVLCENAELGDTGTINGVEYTKRSKDQITVDNASTSCVSGETDFSFMFQSDSNFNEDITHWDVSSATSMLAMFINAGQFNQDISSWNVSNVSDMQNMFTLAASFNQDLDNNNISNEILELNFNDNLYVKSSATLSSHFHFSQVLFSRPSGSSKFYSKMAN